MLWEQPGSPRDTSFSGGRCWRAAGEQEDANTAASFFMDGLADLDEPGPVKLPSGGLILLPLRNMVVFPGTLTPVSVARAASIHALGNAVRLEQPVGLITQRDPSVDDPAAGDLYSVGTTADILRVVINEQGEHQVILRGRQRFRMKKLLQRHPFLTAQASLIEERAPAGKDLEARVLHLRKEAIRALDLVPRVTPGLRALLEGMEDASQLTDLIAGSLDVPVARKQELLECADLQERLQQVTVELGHQIELLALTRKIGEETRGSLEKMQREFFLRQQIKTIQRELGEEHDRGAETEQLRDRLLAAKMPKEVEQRALKDLARLERLPEVTGEHSVVRTWLDLVAELPWSRSGDTQIDLARARRVLDEDHHDLEKVKRRILEYLAVRKLNPDGKSPILCLVGPPGVGKTSLGQSIARATGRVFVRQSMGGIHDEAEVRGHRRTYVGAMPGRIIQAIRRAGTNNPVFMLDEVDKLGAGYHGDPAAALLEVLDPEQNHAFEDHYLDAPFDLSRVMFIATANVLDTIPPALRDRMEVIELPGYTEEDKLHIARSFLVPRERMGAGLNPEQLEIDDGALHEIITSYTREAGVRQLSREIGAVCRAVAVRHAEGDTAAVRVRADRIGELLGPRRFFNEVALRTSLPGVATGLAWTPAGGQILFVEATRMPGEGRLILTGQLGEVMKESAQAALSIIRSRAHALGIPVEEFRQSDIHVHLPAGAIPKDGPSAGLAMFLALASLMLERRVQRDVAVTGEISLRGLVLPVGGVKEKVLAAHRAGITRVLLPALNRKDLQEIPARVRNGMELRFLEHVDEALTLAVEEGHIPVVPQHAEELHTSGLPRH